MVRGDLRRAALLGGQQVGGALVRRLRLAQRAGRGPCLLADLAQFLADPGQLVAELVGLDPGDRPIVLGAGRPLLGLADLARDRGAVGVGTHRLADRLDQVPPAVRPDQIGQRGDLHRVGRRRREAARDRRAQVAGLAHDATADALTEQRVRGELGGDRQPAQPGPAIRGEPGDPPQRHRNLVGGQAGQRGGGQRGDPLPHGLGQRGLRRGLRRRGEGSIKIEHGLRHGGQRTGIGIDLRHGGQRTGTGIGLRRGGRRTGIWIGLR
nr:hypothetical protein GCM10020092_087060 [Actinoplanes digitatis]